MGRPIIHLTGQTFGKLYVLRMDHIQTPGTRSRRWLCRCTCGNEISVRSDKLRTGNTLSCGCHRATHAITHGHAMTKTVGNTPTYQIWLSLRQRCNNPKCPEYSYYGGRNITVCERWNSFENFLADMGERPDGLEIDRIKNEIGYEPNNCVWATRTEQMRNTRRYIARHGSLV